MSHHLHCVRCWSRLGEQGPEMAPGHPLTPRCLVFSGSWTLSSTTRPSWITKPEGTKAVNWWPSGVGTSLPPLAMELPSRRAHPGRGRSTWRCSSLLVMVSKAPGTLCLTRWDSEWRMSTNPCKYPGRPLVLQHADLCDPKYRLGSGQWLYSIT